jgi:HK97 family phage prohead protease
MFDELRDAPPARLSVPILRAWDPADSLEARADADTGMPVLSGHFSKFGNWYRISSLYEGNFLERVAKGAFTKTITEGRAQMRVLFQHGMDPQIGDKVLGPIETLQEDRQGPFYEVPLLDTSYNRDLAPGLLRGLYGASFRFEVVKDKWDHKPQRSEHNPDGIPERTITEARVYEFGPVTWGANPEATATARSMTDRYYDFLRTSSPDVFEGAVLAIRSSRTPAGPTTGAATPDDEPREHSEVPVNEPRSIKAEALALARARALAKQETPS